MSSDSNEVNTRDDFSNLGLEAIEGIGEARRNRLADIGITTVRELAAIAAEDLHSRLQETGRSISLDLLEGWIAAAQNLLEENDQDRSGDHAETASKADEDDGQSKSPADRHEDDSRVEPIQAVETTLDTADEDNNWSTIAAFKLNYQHREVDTQAETRLKICHLQADESQSWTIIKFDELVPWIRARVPLKITQEPAIAEVDERPADQGQFSELASLTIEQVRLLKNGTPLILSFGSQTIAQWVYANQEFAIEVFLNLDSPKDPQLNLQELAQCRFQLVAKALTSNGKDFCYDDLVILTRAKNALVKKALIEKISLSRGLYRLELLLTFSQAQNLSAFADIPRLQVY